MTDIGPQVADEYLYRVVDALDEVARETGKTVPQVALNWLLQRPTVANVIIGARNEEQLRQNLGAVGWNLTPEQVAKLDAASAMTPGLPLLAPARFRGAEPAPRMTLEKTESLRQLGKRHDRKYDHTSKLKINSRHNW